MAVHHLIINTDRSFSENNENNDTMNRTEYYRTNRQGYYLTTAASGVLEAV